MATPEETLKINGKFVAIEPNSFSYIDGSPERNSFPDTAGNILVTEDKLTAKSMVKFSLRSKGENKQLFNEWRSLSQNNAISFVDGELNTNISNAFIKNSNVEIAVGSDTTFEVIFEGKPATQR